MTKLMRNGRVIDMGLVDEIGKSTVLLAGHRFTYDKYDVRTETGGIIHGGNVSLDVASGVDLILTLYEAYMKRSGAYAFHNDTTAPQNVNMPGMLKPRQFMLYETNEVPVPEKVVRASLVHRRWMFPANLSDRRQVSMGVWPAHVALYELYPELYTHQVIYCDPEELGETLAKFGVGVPRQTARYWRRCALTMYSGFDGDPAKVFEHCGWTVAGVEQFKLAGVKKGCDPLPGYGPKITSLCFMYFTSLGLCEMPDDAFPVDMHVQRLFIQYGALTKSGAVGNDMMEMILRPFNCEVARRYTLDKYHQSHAMWQLGRSSCTECYRKRGNELLCPIAVQCSGNVNAHDYFKLGEWPEEDDVMRKGFDRILTLPSGGIIEAQEKVVDRSNAGKLTFKSVMRTAFQHGLFNAK